MRNCIQFMGVFSTHTKGSYDKAKSYDKREGEE